LIPSFFVVAADFLNTGFADFPVGLFFLREDGEPEVGDAGDVEGDDGFEQVAAEDMCIQS